MPRYMNKAELSITLDVSERSLTEWQKEGMPIHKEAESRGQANEYDVAAVVEWIKQRAVARAQVKTPRDELDAIRAKREELGLKKDLGELVPRAELRPLLDRYVADVGSAIDNMPDEIIPLLRQIPDVEGWYQVLQGAARKIRQRLGDYEFCCEVPDGSNSGV